MASEWIDHLQHSVFDINRTVNDVTGISPFRFLYGTDANAAQDLPLSTEAFSFSSPTSKYVYLNIHNAKSLDPRRHAPIKVQMRLSDQLVRVADGRVLNLHNCFSVY